MCKVIISDSIVAAAAADMWKNLQLAIIDSVLSAAEDSEKESEKSAFLKDTANGTLLLIAGTDSRVNENGELVSPDGDVIDGARCFEKITWCTANGVAKTTQYYSAPTDVNTETRARRVVQYWFDYRVRKCADVYDGINAKRESAFMTAKEIEHGYMFLSRFGGGVNDTFISTYRDAYNRAKRFGFSFSNEVVDVFETEK